MPVKSSFYPQPFDQFPANFGHYQIRDVNQIVAGPARNVPTERKVTFPYILPTKHPAGMKV